jgi:hypothetical protein
VPKDYTTQNDLSKRTFSLPFLSFAPGPPSYNFDERLRITQVAVAAIKATHGKVYGYGPSAKVIYVASGGADDWTYGALNVTWSYSVELRDTGKLALSPPAEIVRLYFRLTRCMICVLFRSLRVRVAGQRDRAHRAGDLCRRARDGRLHPPALLIFPILFFIKHF